MNFFLDEIPVFLIDRNFQKYRHTMILIHYQKIEQCTCTIFKNNISKTIVKSIPIFEYPLLLVFSLITCKFFVPKYFLHISSYKKQDFHQCLIFFVDMKVYLFLNNIHYFYNHHKYMVVILMHVFQKLKFF